VNCNAALIKDGFYGNWELCVKFLRKDEGARERQINRPTAIESRGALAALKWHSEIVL
jgi:hypothetical protein